MTTKTQQAKATRRERAGRAVEFAERATENERFAVAAFRVEGGRIVLDLAAWRFPLEDVPAALRLLETELLRGGDELA